MDGGHWECRKHKEKKKSFNCSGCLGADLLNLSYGGFENYPDKQPKLVKWVEK